MGKIIAGAVILVISFFMSMTYSLLFHLVAVIGIVLGLVLIITGITKRPNTSTSDGFGEGYSYSYATKNTGIALSRERQTVKLKNGKNAKEYVFADVRGWETNLQTGGETVYLPGGGGAFSPAFSNSMAVAGMNHRNKKANREASGLFIKVRDIDNPIWRIDMLDKREQNRWMEILTQCINESHIASHASA